MDWNSPALAALLAAALREDHAGEDLTSAALIPPGTLARARLLARQRCRLAGLPLVAPLLDQYCALAPECAGAPPAIRIPPGVVEGCELQAGGLAAEIDGEARMLLGCERTLLNFIQHLSGIATQTARFVAAAGAGSRILDTRKTVPGLRELEKYAVRLGGGINHRPHLAGGILIKNNHLALVGGAGEAFRRARRHYPPEAIEIEVRSREELRLALAAGACWLLLDNMTPDEVRAAAAAAPGARLEASGGIHLENVRDYAQAGIAEISIGALTHSAPAADFSLRLAPLQL